MAVAEQGADLILGNTRRVATAISVVIEAVAVKSVKTVGRTYPDIAIAVLTDTGDITYGELSGRKQLPVCLCIPCQGYACQHQDENSLKHRLTKVRNYFVIPRFSTRKVPLLFCTLLAYSYLCK